MDVNTTSISLSSTEAHSFEAKLVMQGSDAGSTLLQAAIVGRKVQTGIPLSQPLPVTTSADFWKVPDT